jgi:hypothetical protein
MISVFSSLYTLLAYSGLWYMTQSMHIRYNSIHLFHFFKHHTSKLICICGTFKEVTVCMAHSCTMLPLETSLGLICDKNNRIPVQNTVLMYSQ